MDNPGRDSLRCLYENDKYNTKSGQRNLFFNILTCYEATMNKSPHEKVNIRDTLKVPNSFPDNRIRGEHLELWRRGDNPEQRSIILTLNPKLSRLWGKQQWVQSLEARRGSKNFHPPKASDSLGNASWAKIHQSSKWRYPREYQALVPASRLSY